MIFGIIGLIGLTIFILLIIVPMVHDKMIDDQKRNDKIFEKHLEKDCWTLQKEITYYDDYWSKKPSDVLIKAEKQVCKNEPPIPSCEELLENRGKYHDWNESTKMKFTFECLEWNK